MWQLRHENTRPYISINASHATSKLFAISLPFLFYCLTGVAQAELVITEIMSESIHESPTDGDWWELTNTGPSPIALTGYSWDDRRQRAGQNVFGNITIAASESIVIRDAADAEIDRWKKDWNLGDDVHVYDPNDLPGGFSPLSKRDGVFLYDPSGALVASVLYADQVAGRSNAWDTTGGYLGNSISGLNGAHRSANPSPDVASPGYAETGSPRGLAAKVYWTDKNIGKIQRANRDGGELEDVLTAADGLVEPRGLAIDPAAGKMYWADGVRGTIQRANLDGTDIESLRTGLALPRDMELDLKNAKMYWSDLGSAKIQCANLDGTGPIEDIVSGVGEPYYLELDLVNRKIYWADFTNTYIRCKDLDQSGVVEDVITGLSHVRDIIVDTRGDWIYWGDRGSHMVQRARLDGSGSIEDLFGPKGLDRPHGLALDSEAGKIYWTDTLTDAVCRGNVDGSGSVEYVASGLYGPWSVELILLTPDFNGNGVVDWVDFSALALPWRDSQRGPYDRIDLTGDGQVGPADLQKFAEKWLTQR